MAVQQTGLSDIIRAKITLGLPVSNEDVLTLCGIITHNANLLGNLAERITVVESANASKEATHTDKPIVVMFMCMPTRL